MISYKLYQLDKDRLVADDCTPLEEQTTVQKESVEAWLQLLRKPHEDEVPGARKKLQLEAVLKLKKLGYYKHMATVMAKTVEDAYQYCASTFTSSGEYLTSPRSKRRTYISPDVERPAAIDDVFVNEFGESFIVKQWGHLSFKLLKVVLVDDYLQKAEEQYQKEKKKLEELGALNT